MNSPNGRIPPTIMRAITRAIRDGITPTTIRTITRAIRDGIAAGNVLIDKDFPERAEAEIFLLNGKCFMHTVALKSHIFDNPDSYFFAAIKPSIACKALQMIGFKSVLIKRNQKVARVYNLNLKQFIHMSAIILGDHDENMTIKINTAVKKALG